MMATLFRGAWGYFVFDSKVRIPGAAPAAALIRVLFGLFGLDRGFGDFLY